MDDFQFFLGANTPTGFYSLYDELIDRDTASSVYILKGGPGCGKSSFMRRISRYASSAGLEVQSILCSGDPESLDAIVIPALHTALVDGTAPHVVEPICPGVIDHYINLERYYDAEGLQAQRTEIQQLMAKNRAAYRQCYRCLKAAGSLALDVHEFLVTDVVIAKLQKRAKGIIHRELRHCGQETGQITHRFLSAISCQGQLTLWNTISKFKRVYVLKDEYGLAHELLLPILTAAAAQGYDVIACPSPLSPNRLEHLLIPTLGLAFVTSSKNLPYSGSRPYRHLRLDAMLATREEFAQQRNRAKFSKRISTALLDEAVHALQKAKETHDSLERLYNPYVNFSGVYAEADALASHMFSDCVIANQ